jgi:hypothetical protein
VPFLKIYKSHDTQQVPSGYHRKKNNDRVYENVIAYLSAGNCVFVKASGLLCHIRHFPSTQTQAVVRFMLQTVVGWVILVLFNLHLLP